MKKSGLNIPIPPKCLNNRPQEHQMIITIKAKDMQVGDHFKGHGAVKDFVIEDGKVWAHIGRAKHLFAFDVDMDVHTTRKDAE